MSGGKPVQLSAVPAWRDTRVHLLDDSWLLVIFTVLFATAVPWLVSGLAIDFVAAAAGLLALGAIHVGFTMLTSGSAADRWRRRRALPVLHALGIIALAFIWQHAGGLQNPLFLAVFVLPVIGSIFLSRWQPYFMAALAAALVALIASSEAPELRWYAPGLNMAAAWLDTLLSRGTGATPLPFAGFYAPSEYFVVLLEVFVTVLAACAVAAEYLGAIFERLHVQLVAARAEAERGQQLWSTLLEQLPQPALLLDADTFEVICASAAALAKFDTTEERVLGRSVFEVLQLSYPEVVQELIAGSGGAAGLCMLRLGERLLATEVHVQHIVRGRRRFALVTLQDATEAWCVKTALDMSEQAALVVDSRGRVLALNRPAGAIFPGTQLGSAVPQVLPAAESQGHWWNPGLSGRRKMHATIAQRVYQITSSAVALPGEEERFYVLTFVPVAQLATADQSGAALTQRVQRP